MWILTSLLHSRAHQYELAKVYPFSDSVLCLGKMVNSPIESWKNQIQWYSENNYFNELNRIDGKPMEFEWKIFPGFTTAGILNEIQKMMGELQCDPAEFKGKIIFMSMFNDIIRDMKKYVKKIQKVLENTLVDSLAVNGLSWGLDHKRSGTELTMTYKVDLGVERRRKCR